VKRHQRKRRQPKEVSEAFERGLLVEPKLDEPEAEMDTVGAAYRGRTSTPGTSGAPVAVATPQQNTAEALPQAAPAAPATLAMPPVPPLFAAAFGGLAVMNLVLVGLLVRSRR